MRIVIALISSFVATNALAEIDTLTCNTARATYLRYVVHVTDHSRADVSGAHCVLYGEAIVVFANAFDVGLTAEPSQSGRFEMRMDILMPANIYFGRSDFGTGWMMEAGLSADTDRAGAAGSSDVGLRATIPMSEGRTIHVPLRKRRAYSPVDDSDWRYVPLRTADWGYLYIRLGNPDIGLNQTETDL